jgi:hypothetical protein
MRGHPQRLELLLPYSRPFLPSYMKQTARQLLTRVADMGGPSVLGKGGQSWPGLDACKGCPLFKYEEV